jgi:hypothetical protein
MWSRLAAVSLLGLGVRRTQLLDAELRKPLAHVNGLVERLALYDASDEASGEGITGTVGVVDLVFADGVDGHLLDVYITTILRADGDGWVGALGENDGPCALAVLLGHVGDLLGDLLDILGLNIVRLSEGGGFGLVADEDIDIGQDLIERVLEELRDEGGGKVEDELLHKSASEICRTQSEAVRTLSLAAASSASALMAGTQTVKWKPPT